MAGLAEGSRLLAAWRASRLRGVLRGTGQRLSAALQTSRLGGASQGSGAAAIGSSRLVAGVRRARARLDHDLGAASSGRGDRLAAGLALVGFALAGLPLAFLVDAPWAVFLVLAALATVGAVLSSTASREDAVEGSWVLSGKLAEAPISEELTRPAEGSGEDERSSG